MLEALHTEEAPKSWGPLRHSSKAGTQLPVAAARGGGREPGKHARPTCTELSVQGLAMPRELQNTEPTPPAARVGWGNRHGGMQ